MKRKNFLNIFLILLSLFVAVSCCNYEAKPNFFIRSGSTIDMGQSPVAEISVHKRGFWFLWMIPFKRGCEAYAKELMEEEARKVYPGAVGIANYEVTEDINMSLFSWITGTKAKGNIIIGTQP